MFLPVVLASQQQSTLCLSTSGIPAVLEPILYENQESLLCSFESEISAKRMAARR